MYTPVNPFYHIKVRFKGVKTKRHVSVMFGATGSQGKKRQNKKKMPIKIKQCKRRIPNWQKYIPDTHHKNDVGQYNVILNHLSPSLQ